MHTTRQGTHHHSAPPKHPTARKILAMTAHLLTASCALLGFWAMVLLIQGDYANSLRILGLAAFIDAVDGTFARRVDVLRHTPTVDGALLDNISDFITWVFVPLMWAWMVLSVPLWVCMFCVLTSLFGFSHSEAKTPDHFFRGFPSYWNILIVYFVVLSVRVEVASVILIACAVLVLVPIKVIYPSRTSIFYLPTMVLSGLYAIPAVAMLYYLDSSPLWLPVVSLFFPVYYTIASVVAALRARRPSAFAD